MKTESLTSPSKANLAIWLSGAFGLAIVLGAAFVTGFLAWPFSGKTSASAKPKTEVKTNAVTPNVPRPQYDTPPSGRYDAAAGEAALAKLWADIDAVKLAAITAEWRPIEIAPILMKMKGDKVSELLSEMKPERASAISREIQRISSR